MDQAALWVKLTDAGATGPLLDLMRQLYAQLRYILRFIGETTRLFRALAGILAGDPITPAFWLLFLADLKLTPYEDDLLLDGRVIDLLLIADDVASMSMSVPGINYKGVEIAGFCGHNLLFMCVPKSLYMVFNVLPRALPDVCINGGLIDFTDTAAYAGMTFTSSHCDIFVRHYEAKALTAWNVANTSLSLESRVGTIPPVSIISMYKALIEPHLVYGCEAALDVRPLSLKPLLNVQSMYLCRSLGLGPRSQLAPLYTETGVWPIRYRWVYLTLWWLRYVVRDRPPLPLAAVREAWQLAQDHHSSWWGDLCLSLLELPVAVLVQIEEMPTVDSVYSALAQVELPLTRHLFDSVMLSERLPILQARFRRLSSPVTLSHVCRQRPYLSVSHPKHREALVHLISSDHPLGVETGRRQGWEIPRHCRVCRFCRRRGAVEDEVHALLACEDPRLADLRERELLSALESQVDPLPGARRMYARVQSWDFLDFLLRAQRLHAALSHFVFLVFKLVDSVPPLFLASDAEWQALDV
ncbi:hypothetical protein K466DRAFT_505100 [Polyporus arcularius HHB13444]|uniref:Reverse transcriptase domain-containing protein n=1 Tax=Polyporus arcularius HHB13444 TaxID=1314778 RepID=A0A5C3NUR1_9APHY|nr:hypothetical protein K466DRAFT_505100 [Polyporus arcularius HHB13444]